MKLNFKYSLCCMLLLCSTMTGYAQRGYTMNFLDLVPQQNKFNPAYYTRYKSYVGIPLLSSVQFQVNNDAFSINRAFIQRPDRKLLDPLGIAAGLSAENNLGIDVGVDIFSLGFKIGENNQIHVGLGIEAYGNLLLTKNTLNLLFLQGPGHFLGIEGANALSGNNFDLNVYGALSLGYSREINEKLSVGGRVKLLSGFANLYTDRSNIHLFIDDGHDPEITPYTYFIKPNLALNGSFSNVPQDSNLLYAMRNLGSVIGLPNSLLDNFGMGLDFGAVYQVNENVRIAASVYDIGFIDWKSNVQRITSKNQEKPFVFSGVGELTDLINSDGFRIQEIFTALWDSAVDYFQLNEVDTTFTSYRSPLRTSYNLSGFFNLTDYDQIGVMWNSQLGKQKHNALTIAYMRSIGRNFQVCISNAFINETVFNFGGGFAVNAGPFQFYLVVDKISSFQVIDMRAANIHFGLNVVLNRTEKNPNKRQQVRDFTPRDRTGYVNDRWAW